MTRFLMMFWVTLLAILVSGETFASAQSAPVVRRVMTYNIRHKNQEDPISWSERGEEIIELITERHPDVFGVQEALHGQMTDLRKGLPNYAAVGVGRGIEQRGKKRTYRDTDGEYNAIFYKLAAYKLLNSGTFWLSEHPEIPATTFQNNVLPRIATWAQLQDRETQRHLFVLNTHFAYETGDEGVAARAHAVQLILARLQRLAPNEPVILMGDLNFTVEREDDMQASYLPLASLFQDSFVAAVPHIGAFGTYVGFEKDAGEGERLDYIFLSRQPEVIPLSYATLDEDIGDYYLSDHLPVEVAFTLPIWKR
jgi:Metal-dependent hydrolase